ncbi:hypothetical protein A0H81_12776 [Grifola frondosa]|uniref:F-box domain-containing protein n=1 Tax=Grifola frondosa TaxID=5627 RepID=A0A1C7LQR9_GRIFR|nr:hypothetical protein A0H81_12776 [Grifola frondosa]
MVPLRSPRLPLELTDMVIHYLHDDMPSLSACSLTCRDWLPRAQSLQFKAAKIYIDNWKDFQTLFKVSRSLASFVRVLKIAKTVKVKRYLSPSNSDVAQWKEGLPAIVSDVHLPRLTDLSLDYMEFDGSLFGGCRIQSIHSVTLSHCQFKDMPELIRLLSSFPKLKNVEAHTPHVSSDLVTNTLEVADAKSLPAIISFAIHRASGCFMMQILQCFICEPIFKDLSGLVLPLFQEGAASLKQFLETCGSRLQKLVIYLEPDFTLEALSKPEFTLAHCTNLQTLEFEVPSLGDSTQVENTGLLDWVPYILSQVSSPHLQCFTFHLYDQVAGADDMDRHLNALDWKRVEDILAGFEALREVTMRLEVRASVGLRIIV